jgi:hypothetical protein
VRLPGYAPWWEAHCRVCPRSPTPPGSPLQLDRCGSDWSPTVDRHGNKGALAGGARGGEPRGADFVALLGDLWTLSLAGNVVAHDWVAARGAASASATRLDVPPHSGLVSAKD